MGGEAVGAGWVSNDMIVAVSREEGYIMATIGVFAGARDGTPDLMAEIEMLITALAEEGFDFVYGGASTGAMGIVERVGLAHGRSVIGVIPAGGEGDERYSPKLTALEVVPTRADRKARIIELADVLVALPGGVGTLEEVAEAWSLVRQRAGSTRCVLFNAHGFYDPLLAQVERMEGAGFVSSGVAQSIRTPTEIAHFIAEIR